MRREEMLIRAPIRERARRRRPSARAQARARRRNRQIAGGEVRILHRRVAHRLEVLRSASAKLIARHRGCAPEMRIILSQPHVREAVATVQRRKPSSFPAMESGVTEASPVAAPPRMKVVTRSNREPADRAPAPSKAETWGTEIMLAQVRLDRGDSTSPARTQRARIRRRGATPI